jgi:RHS repeat-associated protein
MYQAGSSAFADEYDESFGDVTRIYNMHTGAFVGEYVYDAWGKIIYQTNNTITNANPFRYRSYYYDTESGFYYLNSRYYDPETGRFINADDPTMLLSNAGIVGGANLFAYCLNNPIMRIDNLGKSSHLNHMVSVIRMEDMKSVFSFLSTENNLWTTGRYNVNLGFIEGVEVLFGHTTNTNYAISNDGIILIGGNFSAVEFAFYILSTESSPIRFSANLGYANAWVGSGFGIMLSALTLELDNSYFNIQGHAGAIGISLGLKNGTITGSIAYGFGVSFTINGKKIIGFFKSLF